MASQRLRIEMSSAIMALAHGKRLSIEHDRHVFVVSSGPVSFAVTDEPAEHDTIISEFDCGYLISDPEWQPRGYWADE